MCVHPVFSTRTVMFLVFDFRFIWSKTLSLLRSVTNPTNSQLIGSEINVHFAFNSAKKYVKTKLIHFDSWRTSKKLIRVCWVWREVMPLNVDGRVCEASGFAFQLVSFDSNGFTMDFTVDVSDLFALIPPKKGGKKTIIQD